MKYIIVSLMCGGLLIASSLTAQNTADSEHRILNGSPVTSTIEDEVTEISSRELILMNKSMNDFSTATWSRDIYREIFSTEGNEMFYQPTASTDKRVNLFSLLINLVSDKTVPAYDYDSDPSFVHKTKVFDPKELLDMNKIAYTASRDRIVSVSREDIAKSTIVNFFIKEKWFFDDKTGKGDVRVVGICPVICDRGRQFPMFWVSFDDISVYLARAVTPMPAGVASKSMAGSKTVSMFDLLRNRYYKGAIYQVGLRNLTTFFPTADGIAAERQKIEKELDFIQARFETIAAQ